MFGRRRGFRWHLSAARVPPQCRLGAIEILVYDPMFYQVLGGIFVTDFLSSDCFIEGKFMFYDSLASKKYLEYFVWAYVS